MSDLDIIRSEFRAKPNLLATIRQTSPSPIFLFVTLACCGWMLWQTNVIGTHWKRISFARKCTQSPQWPAKHRCQVAIFILRLLLVEHRCLYANASHAHFNSKCCDLVGCAGVGHECALIIYICIHIVHCMATAALALSSCTQRTFRNHLHAYLCSHRSAAHSFINH